MIKMIECRKWALSSSEGVGKANLNSGVKFYRDQPFPLSSCAILIWSPILAKLRFSLVAQLSGAFLWVTLISLQLLLLNLFALFHKVNFFKNNFFSNNLLWFMHGCELWTISIILFLEMCHIFVGVKVLVMKISHAKQKPKRKELWGKKNLWQGQKAYRKFSLFFKGNIVFREVRKTQHQNPEFGSKTGWDF